MSPRALDCVVRTVLAEMDPRGRGVKFNEFRQVLHSPTHPPSHPSPAGSGLRLREALADGRHRTSFVKVAGSVVGVWVGSLTPPFSPRPPISFATSVARTEGYTHDAEVWAVCLVQGPFPVPPNLQTCKPNRLIRNFYIAVGQATLRSWSSAGSSLSSFTSL
jgi:hypothetical protein